jgi:hypothetical protein
MAASSVVILRIDNNDEVTGNPSTGGNNRQLGPGDTVADTYTVFFSDLIFDDAAYPDSTARVELAVPSADSAVGSGWTDSGGSSTNLFQSVDNTPPTGIADTTSNAGHQVRNASSALADYVATLPTYTAMGLATGDTVNAVKIFCSRGAPVTTGAKSGSLAGSNPTQTAVTFASYFSGTTAGTYPTGWLYTEHALAAAPSVTLGTAPTITLAITGGTSTRIAMCCSMGMWVEYTPAAAAAAMPLDLMHTPWFQSLLTQ